MKTILKNHVIKHKKVKYVHIEKTCLSILQEGTASGANLEDNRYIVHLYHTFQDSSNLYFVLQYAKQGDILDMLKRIQQQHQQKSPGSYNTGMDESALKVFMLQLAKALMFMHNRGVIHRDLKPENVLLHNDCILLTDFGSAKITGNLDAALDQAGSSSNGITNGQVSDGETKRSHSFVGTAEYVSPEVLKGDEATAETDYWSLGCIIYHLLLGKPPFKSQSEYIIFQKISKLEYVLPSFISQDAQDIIVNILKERGQRNCAVAEMKWFNSVSETGVKVDSVGSYVPEGGWENHTEEANKFYIETPLSLNLNMNTTNIPTLQVPDSPLTPNSPTSPISPTMENKWQRFLYKDETIIYASPVHKRRYFFSPQLKRYLILTSLPRLFYVDEDQMQEKGEVNLDGAVIDFKDDSRFCVITKDYSKFNSLKEALSSSPTKDGSLSIRDPKEGPNGSWRSRDGVREYLFECDGDARHWCDALNGIMAKKK